MSKTAEVLDRKPQQEVTAIAQTSPPLAAVPESTAIIQMIERAARDPNVDIDKMERLLAMQERVIEREAKAAFDVALSEVQPQLPVIDRKGKITIRDKNDRTVVIQSTPYALFEDINEAIKPKLAEYGFGVSFRTGLTEDGRVKVTGILSHRGGHREETTMVLPHDSTGSKNAVQAIGSSTSYGKRYALCALLNITTRGEDDDGKAGGDDGPISDEQAAEINRLAIEVKANLAKFLFYMKVDSIPNIPAKQYQRAVDALEAKRPKS